MEKHDVIVVYACSMSGVFDELRELAGRIRFPSRL
jgi:hypothetical protein